MKHKKSVLTPRAKVFCQEYLIDFNATKAMQRAGYSYGSAGSAAGRMLKRIEIQAEIKKIAKEKTIKTEITVEYVLTNIKKIGEHCIAENKETGALKAQELLGKYLKLFDSDAQKGNTYIYADLRKTIGDSAPERVRSIITDLRARISDEKSVVID